MLPLALEVTSSNCSFCANNSPKPEETQFIIALRRLHYHRLLTVGSTTDNKSQENVGILVKKKKNYLAVLM